jgi:hypothetical protein
MSRSCSIVAVVAALAACLGFAQPARAQAGTGSPAEQVLTMRAEAATLGDVLQQLMAVLSVDLRIEPGVEKRSVSVAFDRVDARTALIRVLHDSGLNFVVSGLDRTDGQPIRVVLGDPGKATALALAVKKSDNPAPAEAPAAPQPPAPAAARDERAPDKPQTKEAGGAVGLPVVPPSREEELAISETLDAGQRAAAAVPLGPYAKPTDAPGSSTASRPGQGTASKTTPAPAVLPFPDKDGKPIPIVFPPKGPGG